MIYNRYQKLRKAIKYSDGSIVYIVPYEEKKGELVSQTDYETLEDCQYDYQFRWYKVPFVEDDASTYICEGVSQYYKEVYQKSIDGIIWSDVEPKQERKGDLINQYSEECGFKPLIKWVVVETDLSNPDTYICEDFDLFALEKEYISYDNGSSYEPTGNIRKGSIIDNNSTYCGFNGAIIITTPTNTDISYAYVDKDGIEHKSVFQNRLDLSQFTNGEKGIIVQYEDFYRGQIYLSFESIRTNMFLRFNDFDKISELAEIDTRDMTDMSYMFVNCSYDLHTDWDISHFITSGVTNMSHMFYHSGMPSSNILNMFDTSKVTDMSYMFSKSANSDFTLRFDTNNVTNMEGMFDDFNCDVIRLYSKFNTSNVTNMSHMFANCKAGIVDARDSFITSNVTDMSYMFYNTNISNEDGYYSIFDRLDTSNVTNMSYMFSQTTGLSTNKTITLDTSKVTDMSYMFAQSGNLFNVDIGSFDTSNVTNMEGMFNYNKIGGLNIRFNTINVTNMSKMFSNCQYLTSIYLNNLNTSNVTNMKLMFDSCSQITFLDLSSFNTSKVTNMQNMFADCRLLNRLYLDNFDTTNVTDMGLMFYNTNINYIRCKQAFKEWCILNQDTIRLPAAMRIGGRGVWEIVD